MSGRKRRVASAKTIYCCQYCGNPFLLKRDKIAHEKLHTGAKPMLCNVCGKSFMTAYTLSKHEARHQEGDRKFQCKFCDEMFSLKRDCTIHEDQHLKNGVLKCSICGKEFKSRYTLMTHEYSHTGLLPYKCCYCDERFAMKRECKAHEMSHTGASPLACKICLKAFCSPYTLKYHEKRNNCLPPGVTVSERHGSSDSSSPAAVGIYFQL